jgi:magnesium transporter
MKLFSKKYNEPGTRPGVLTERGTEIFTIDLVDYSENAIDSQLDISETQCRTFIDNANVTWIHVQGDPSTEALHALAKGIDIHDLYIEDVANTGQRPKAEINDAQLFIILSLPVFVNDKIAVEQVSLFLTQNTVVSFCSGEFNPFLPVRERLKNGLGKLRRRKADYLLYSLLDVVIDYGFPLLEVYSEKIQSLEDDMLDNKDDKLLGQIHQLPRELLLLRRKLWPQREVVNELIRDEESSLMSSETKMHFRDCHGHVISIMELLETYHEMTSGLMELYMTRVSLKMNDVMKVLTIIATLFIPPTFIVGVYGMNFDPLISPLNMPEIGWKYGYIAVWVLLIGMFSGMLMLFRRRKWI